jgi:internalin A
MDKPTKTIQQLITDVKENNLTKLNFYDSDEIIEEIPDEVYELTNIEELNLGSSQVKDISPKISNLNKLEIFNASKSDFEKFPLELMEVSSLTDIFLGSMKLKELPKELDRWDTLTYLNLRNSENLKLVVGLPPNLRYLYTTGPSLSKLPERLFGLNKLTKLVAEKIQLEKLPIKLFEMVGLIALFIIDCEIKSIPDEIYKLTDLEILTLRKNKFKDFPDAITNLSKLEKIDLAGNHLKQIPSSILKLKSLKDINLGNNNFMEIPNILFEMVNLQEISFGNYLHNVESTPLNTINNISGKLLNLMQLKKIDLFENPIENVPKEILKDTEAIKNYLRSKAEADTEEFLYEAKMVMVGRGNVGKTVLTKKLTDPDYELSESKTTHRISVLKNPFLFPIKSLENDYDFKFNIWDFGGQEKYDATHQLFITNRSIYLFLTEARVESNYLDFYYWLNTIRLFSSNSPVIVVLSKYDERKKLLPVAVYKEKFDNIVQFVDVSCAKGWEYTIQNLKVAIQEAIQLLPQTKQKFSNHWLDIPNALEKLSLERDYIDYDEYLEICKEHKLDKIQANFLSQFLNDLGVIIHRQQDLLLKKTVFMKTDWCVDGMYKVLDDKLVFDNNGKYTDKDLSRIWNEKRFENKQAELLKLMKGYNLCFELRDGSGYIAPDILPPDKPKDLKWDTTNNLQFEFRYDFMPAGMVSRFIVKSHSFIKDNLFWKYGVMLEYDQTQALVEEDYIHGKIKISLKGDNKKGLLSAIRMYIDEVHKDFDKANKLVFEEMVPCNCSECFQSITPHFYKFNVLKKFGLMRKNGV